jgi:hypothetical protein
MSVESLHTKIISRPYLIESFYDLYEIQPDLDNLEYISFLEEVTDTDCKFEHKLLHSKLFSDVIKEDNIKKLKFKVKHTKKEKPEKEYRDKLFSLTDDPNYTLNDFLNSLED